MRFGHCFVCGHRHAGLLLPSLDAWKCERDGPEYNTKKNRIREYTRDDYSNYFFKGERLAVWGSTSQVTSSVIYRKQVSCLSLKERERGHCTKLRRSTGQALAIKHVPSFLLPPPLHWMVRNEKTVNSNRILSLCVILWIEKDIIFFFSRTAVS